MHHNMTAEKLVRSIHTYHVTHETNKSENL